jgi:hypothetical protein
LRLEQRSWGALTETSICMLGEAEAYLVQAQLLGQAFELEENLTFLP